ncbi:MAG: hypothetical protein JEY99_14510 [Spirochaetales bacterium]|nr:hypothetical protein [Spirochaetales bacterium]
MERKIFRRSILLLISLLFLPFIYAYDVPLPENEAPASLFDLDMENEDVELFIKGNWDAKMSASWGFGYSKERGLFQDSSHASIPVGFDFEQQPDITLSLWLFDRYFIETNFGNDWESNTYLVGYKGDENEFLQSVQIGNTRISMDDYAYWKVPAIPENGFGGSAAFLSGISTHEMLLRLDPAESQSVIYQGSNLLEEEFINPGGYIKNRFFILPTRPVSDLLILTEDPDASINSVTYTGDDGKGYYLMDDSNYNFDSVNGVLILEAEPSGNILISYPEMDTEMTFDDNLPWDSSTESYTPETVSVDGIERLILFSPGEFSIFETNRYYTTGLSLPEDEAWRMKGYLVSGGNLNDLTNTLNISFEENGVFALESSGYTPGTILNSYPLSDLTENMIYGPNRTIGDDEQNQKILLQVVTPVTSYQLNNPMAGSVTVMINDIQTTAFTLSDSGELIFPGYIHPSDRIEISYRTESSTDSGGDILFGMGNRFTILPDLSLEIGTGLRWNLYSGEFTTEINESQGSLLTSFKAEYAREHLNIELEGGISLSTGDTTGIFKALGMDDGGIVFSIPEFGILPSALPADREEDKRGPLYFKDYHIYSNLGASYLQDYTWDIPDSRIFPYEQGARTGPYTALASSDGRSGNILVLDYLLPETNSWAGAQIPWSTEDELLDLSSYKALNLAWKWDGDIPEDVTVYLEIGTLGEDVDGDGILDEESSGYANGFTFNDGGSDISLDFGGSENDSAGETQTSDGYRHTEDINGNSYLNAENPGKVVCFAFNSGDLNYPSGGWEYIRVPLTAENKAKLTGVSGARIYVVNNGASAVEGRLLTGDFFFEGSSMIPAQPELSDAFQPGDTWEGQLPEEELPVKSLESSFSEVSTVFHSSGSTQKIFRLGWDSSLADADWNNEWEIRAFTNAVYLSSYSKLSFYIRIPELTAGDDNRFYIQYTDSEGRGVSASFTPQIFFEWEKITIDLETGEIEGEALEITAPEVDISPGNYTVTKVKFGMTDTSAGLLFLDEIHLSGSKSGLTAGGRGNLTYSNPEARLTIGGFPIFENISIKGDGFYQGSSFAAGIDSTATAGELNALGGNITTAFNLIAGSFVLNGDIVSFGDEISHSESHEVTLPAAAFPVKITDRYGETIDSDGKEFSRSNTLTIAPSSVFMLTAENYSSLYNQGSGNSIQGLLIRDWNLTLSSTLIEIVSLTGSLNLQQSCPDWEQENLDYFNQWINGFALIMPSTDYPDNDRKGSALVRFNIDALPIGGWLTAMANYSTGTSQGFGIKNSGGTWSGGLSLKGKGKRVRSWNLALDYNRNFSWKRSWDEYDFLHDGSSYFEEISEMPYLYQGIPFVEIYSDSFIDDFSRINGFSWEFTDKSYSPWYTFSLVRSSGSYLTDLLIPSSLAFTQKRETSLGSGEYSDILGTDLSIQLGSINLFGSRGAYPTFSEYYETEELRMILAYEHEKDLLSDSTEKSELILQNYIFFRFSKINSLWLNNRFSMEFSDQSFKNSGTLSWTRSPEELPGFNFFEKPVFEEASIQHSEEAEFSLNSEEDTLDVSILYTHDTSIIFPFGSIGIFGSAGVEIIDNEDGKTWLFGILAGLNAKFSY